MTQRYNGRCAHEIDATRVEVTTQAVERPGIATDPKAREFVVKLDGVVVLYTGGLSRWDACEADSFALGLSLGLKQRAG